MRDQVSENVKYTVFNKNVLIKILQILRTQRNVCMPKFYLRLTGDLKSYFLVEN